MGGHLLIPQNDKWHFLYKLTFYEQPPAVKGHFSCVTRVAAYSRFYCSSSVSAVFSRFRYKARPRWDHVWHVSSVMTNLPFYRPHADQHAMPMRSVKCDHKQSKSVSILTCCITLLSGTISCERVCSNSSAIVISEARISRLEPVLIFAEVSREIREAAYINN